VSISHGKFGCQAKPRAGPRLTASQYLEPKPWFLTASHGLGYRGLAWLGLRLQAEPFTSLDGMTSFVCTLFVDDMDEPVLLRSYNTPTPLTSTNTPAHANIQMPRIVFAARATSAAPTFFKAVDFGDLCYVNGGLWCNNPIHYVMDEAISLFPGRPISSLLSLGTGNRTTICLPPSTLFQNVMPTNIIRVLQEVVMDCRQEAAAMKTMLEYMRQLNLTPPLYTQLSVDQGVTHGTMYRYLFL